RNVDRSSKVRVRYASVNSPSCEKGADSRTHVRLDSFDLKDSAARIHVAVRVVSVAVGVAESGMVPHQRIVEAERVVVDNVLDSPDTFHVPPTIAVSGSTADLTTSLGVDLERITNLHLMRLDKANRQQGGRHRVLRCREVHVVGVLRRPELVIMVAVRS